MEEVAAGMQYNLKICQITDLFHLCVYRTNIIFSYLVIRYDSGSFTLNW